MLRTRLKGGLFIPKFSHTVFVDNAGLSELRSPRDDLVKEEVESENVIWTQLSDGAMVHPIETDDPSGGASHVAFQVEDFEDAIKKLNELGINIEDGPGERFDGQRFLFIRDPDGNRIELTTKNNIKKNNRVSDNWGYTSD